MVLGGSKVSDKLGVINNLVTKVNKILIGGGMAFTFLKAQGYEVGDSLLEVDRIEEVKQLLLRLQLEKERVFSFLELNMARIS